MKTEGRKKKGWVEEMEREVGEGKEGKPFEQVRHGRGQRGRRTTRQTPKAGVQGLLEPGGAPGSRDGGFGEASNAANAG